MLRTALALSLVLALAAQVATACPSPAGSADMTDAALRQVNSYRHAKGLPPVAQDPRLQSAARSHACDSAKRGRLGHQGSDGSTLADRAARAGYPFRELAENVAQGYPDAPSVVQGWIDSRGHRRNLLMRGAQDAGIGLARDAGGDLHWVLVLGRD